MKSKIKLTTSDIQVNKKGSLKIQWFELAANIICNNGKLHYKSNFKLNKKPLRISHCGFTNHKSNTDQGVINCI